MPDITPSKSIDIQKELNNLAIYRYHPNGIFNTTINRCQDMVEGKIELVDPSNPFIYLLETNCLNTSYAIQEFTLLNRKRYPRLANNEEDLYLHMSDKDYLGRFAEPVWVYVDYKILFSDFKTKAKYDPVLREHVLTLPRHLKLTIDNHIFTLQSAIIIRQTENGVIDVKFENQNYGSVFPVTTNFIDFKLTSFNQEETYINFKIHTPEVDLETVELPVEKSKLFKDTISYNPSREFYYFRCYHFINGRWEEMIVTHTDQVYDIYTPTCAVKVNQLNKEIEYYIPPVYINTSRLGTKVKFIVYTTKGPVNVNFGDYKLEDFKSEYNPVFPDEELNDTTEPLQLITKLIYIKDKVVGGKGPITFEELKEAVIDNSIGDRKLPVTNKQLDFDGEQNNFRVIRDVDIVTNRIFLLECDIPNSPSRYPVTKLNMDLIEFKSTITEMSTGKNNVFGINDNITILPEGTVFEITEDGTKLLDYDRYISLKAMSDIELSIEVNSKRYLSLFYHYVLDTSGDTTELRAYDLSSPSVQEVNFKGFNPTTRIGINTTSVNLHKTDGGFTLDVLSNMKRYMESLNETNLTPYLVYRDNNDSMFYLEGRLFTSIETNPVYRFDILSDYYIDQNNLIHINNFRDSNGVYIQVAIPLNAAIELIYVSNTIPLQFKASELDSHIYGSFLAIDKAVVTLESLDVRFGDWLEHLYTRVHTSTGTYEYTKYDEDVPLRYESIVYNSNNEPIHHVGDVVMDEETLEPVLKHRKGDLMQGEDGSLIPTNKLELVRYMNFLFIDYRVTLATGSLFKDYYKYIKSYLTEKITENAKQMQSILLDNTVGYVIVPKNLDNIKVRHKGMISYIKSTQDFRLMVHVSNRIYEDANARKGIEDTILTGIEEYLYSNNKLSKTVLLTKLYGGLKEFIKGISIDKFTELNEEYIEIVDSNARIGLNKILQSEANGYNLIDDVVISFVKVDE